MEPQIGTDIHKWVRVRTSQGDCVVMFGVLVEGTPESALAICPIAGWFTATGSKCLKRSGAVLVALHIGEEDDGSAGNGRWPRPGTRLRVRTFHLRGHCRTVAEKFVDGFVD